MSKLLPIFYYNVFWMILDRQSFLIKYIAKLILIFCLQFLDKMLGIVIFYYIIIILTDQCLRMIGSILYNLKIKTMQHSTCLLIIENV